MSYKYVMRKLKNKNEHISVKLNSIKANFHSSEVTVILLLGWLFLSYCLTWDKTSCQGSSCSALWSRSHHKAWGLSKWDRVTSHVRLNRLLTVFRGSVGSGSKGLEWDFESALQEHFPGSRGASSPFVSSTGVLLSSLRFFQHFQAEKLKRFKVCLS